MFIQPGRNCDLKKRGASESEFAENGSWRKDVLNGCLERSSIYYSIMAATRLRNTFKYAADDNGDDNDLPRDMDEEGDI